MTTHNASRPRITALFGLVAAVAGTALSLPIASADSELPASDDLSEQELAAANGETEPTLENRKRARRYHTRMALELSAIMAIGNVWYWRDDGQPNVVDWQLEHDMSAVRAKLGTTDGWRFDGNEFDINALGHPGFGMLTHFLGRQNGYTMAETFLISTLASGAWEVVLELAEYGSVNDMLSTSTAGVPLGETAYQIIHHADETEFEARAGVGTENGAAFAVVTASGDLDRVPTTGRGTVLSGRKVRFEASMANDSEGVRAVDGVAEANLAGYYRNRADDSVFVGISTEFVYRNQRERAERAWDMLSTVSVGPTLDVQLRRGEVTVDIGADLYLDYAMVKSQAFDNWRTDHPMEVVRNVMQDKERPYYYAMGASIDPRVEVSYRKLTVGAAVTAQVLSSLDGADRDQEMLTSDAHMTDRDVGAQASVGYQHDRMSLVLDGTVGRRSGSMGDAHGETDTHGATLTFGYRR